MALCLLDSLEQLAKDWVGNTPLKRLHKFSTVVALNYVRVLCKVVGSRKIDTIRYHLVGSTVLSDSVLSLKFMHNLTLIVTLWGLDR